MPVGNTTFYIPFADIVMYDKSVCLVEARITGLQEDNKNWKHSLSKVELERKQVQDRCNVLEKVL